MFTCPAVYCRYRKITTIWREMRSKLVQYVDNDVRVGIARAGMEWQARCVGHWSLANLAGGTNVGVAQLREKIPEC